MTHSLVSWIHSVALWRRFKPSQSFHVAAVWTLDPTAPERLLRFLVAVRRVGGSFRGRRESESRLGADRAAAHISIVSIVSIVSLSSALLSLPVAGSQALARNDGLTRVWTPGARYICPWLAWPVFQDGPAACSCASKSPAHVRAQLAAGMAGMQGGPDTIFCRTRERSTFASQHGRRAKRS